MTRPHMEEYYDRTPEQSYSIWRKRENGLRGLRWLIGLPMFVGVVAIFDFYIRNSKAAAQVLPPEQLAAHPQTTISLSSTVCFVPIIIVALLIVARLMLANRESASELRHYKPAKQPKEPKQKKAQPIEQPERRKSIAQLKQDEIDKQRQQYQEQQHREKAERSERKSKKRLPGYINVEQEKRKANNGFWKSVGMKSPDEYKQEERLDHIMNIRTEED